MRDSHLIFAPSYNAYRRFQAGNHAPTQPNWGYDNRTTAVRIPASPSHATRIEHRVAGADSNPYLAVAALLAGIAIGIEGQLKPADPISGNAWVEDEGNPCLPPTWQKPFTVSRSRTRSVTCSPPHFSCFSELKKQELLEFERRVTDFELETYLAMQACTDDSTQRFVHTQPTVTYSAALNDLISNSEPTVAAAADRPAAHERCAP